MDFMLDVGSFGLKVLMVAVALGAILVVVISLLRRGSRTMGHIAITHLGHHYDHIKETLQRAVLTKKEWKKARNQAKKERELAIGTDPVRRVYVLEFDGDIVATQVAALREQVSAVLSVANPEDEIVLEMESSGGMVHHYGLAAAQLVRLREAGIPLTVCVDRVAASGGYMMACIGDRILAAPFAVLGSIGVLIMMPNLNRFLKKHDIDFVELTAGQYKQTLSPLGEMTKPGLQKTREELEETHSLFKEFVARYRPGLDVEQVSTGETWYGTRALELGMVDEIRTSDDYLMSRREAGIDIYRIDYEYPKSMREKVAGTIAMSLDRLVMRWWSRVMDSSKTR